MTTALLAIFQKFPRFIAWCNYLWACYLTLLGNFPDLSAENTRLTEILANANSCLEAAQSNEEYAFQWAINSIFREQQAEERAADAEKRAAAAEKHAENARNRVDELNDVLDSENAVIRNLHCDVAEAQQSAQYWQYCAEEAEQRLEAVYQQEAAEAAILHELSFDQDWSSGSKRNFVAKQTEAVLNARRETVKCQMKIDQLTQLMLDLKGQLPFDIISQSTVQHPVILIPSLKTLDPKIMNKESVSGLKDSMYNQFPIGHGATIEKVYECADLKNMFAAIQKFLKLCGHDLDE